MKVHAAMPQVESFHSYGGLEQVANPLPDTSLCIISASSSMNLHRKWIREKALSARDIVTLDPENFARFNEGIIQASLLRAALPSELDYRGDVQASAYMKTFLCRVAARFDLPQMATLEFLVAISTERMQLNAEDTASVREAFQQAIRRRSNPMAAAVRFLLDEFPSPERDRQAF